MARVLIVDDDALVRSVVARVLEGQGFDVQQAHDGRAGLEALRRETFELVITDLRMPQLGGERLIEALRSVRPDLPILAISGMHVQGDPRAEAEMARLGATRTLAKPFEGFELLALVHELLARPAP